MKNNEKQCKTVNNNEKQWTSSINEDFTLPCLVPVVIWCSLVGSHGVTRSWAAFALCHAAACWLLVRGLLVGPRWDLHVWCRIVNPGLSWIMINHDLSSWSQMNPNDTCFEHLFSDVRYWPITCRVNYRRWVSWCCCCVQLRCPDPCLGRFLQDLVSQKNGMPAVSPISWVLPFILPPGVN
jgi:hypothetical protein